MYRRLSRALGGATIAVALATTGTAGAAPGESSRDAGRDDTPSYRMVAPAGDEPASITRTSRRTIYSDVKPQNGRLYLIGDVSDYAGRIVKIQRSACESCRWRRFDLTRTGGHGWFRAAIKAPRVGTTYWRAKVAPSNGYGRSFSAIWETGY